MSVAELLQQTTAAPTDPEGWCRVGAEHRNRQRYPEAIAAYRSAIALDPDRATSHNGLGIAFACWRRFADAEVSFHRAIALQSPYPNAWNNLGNALSEQRKLTEAISTYETARTQGYAGVGLEDSLGQVYARTGDLDAAAGCFRKVLVAQPNDGSVMTRLAVVLARTGDLPAAADLMARALGRPKPDADVFHRLGIALADKSKLDLAIRAYDQALALQPNEWVVLNHQATARLQQGRLDDAAALFRKAVAVNPADLWSRSSLLYLRTNDPTADPDDLLDEHVAWARRYFPLPKGRINFPHDRTPDRIVRVGYVSADFKRHPVGRFMQEVLAAHDASRVDVFCYDEANRPPDEVTDRLRAAAPHWRELKGQTDEQVADVIRSDRIDVLVDLAGHTGGNRIGVFARRPAPVQVTYLGYPNTTGLAAIDYILVDAVTQPPGEPAKFIEEPVRLAGGFSCYPHRDDAPLADDLPAKRNGYVTFGAFHNLTKLNPTVLALWARVLAAVPNSRLLIGRNTLSGDTAADLKAKLAAAGLPADRIDLKHLVPGPAAFLEAYLAADVSLDTVPWSGHTTACDSLWMGVPVVTLRGATHAGRMAASVLTHVGLPDWIADTPDNFVATAVRQVADLDKLAALRASLRERMRASKLCDATGFTRHLEDAYRAMWRRWCGTDADVGDPADAMVRADRHRKENRWPQAEAAFRAAVRVEPTSVEGWTGLAAVCHAANKLNDAVAHYRQALGLRPQDPRTHNSLGIVYAKQLRFADAANSFRSALDWNPEYAKAHNNLGNALSEQGDLDGAAAAFQASITHGFVDAAVHCNLAIVASRQGFLARAEEEFRAALHLDPAYASARSALLFLRNYDPEADPTAVLAEHIAWGKSVMPATPPAQHANSRDPDRLLRVGYVSPDFRNHPVGRFIEPVLTAHDPSRVVGVCYDAAPYPPDAVTARLRQIASEWVVTRGMTTADLVARIRADRIDLLIDLAGHTAHNRLDAFAHSPAPIQITYLGYPNTTGLPAIHYAFVDATTLPTDSPIGFTETPIRLAGGFSCFAPPLSSPPVAPLPARRNGFITFGSTHGLIKLNRAVFELWAAVLRAVPNSRLRIVRDMLSTDAMAWVRRELTAREVTLDRLEFVKPPPGAESYWDVYADIDVALDAFPWTGHTTACEALWMGVPVLTLRGRTHAGRMVASVLTHGGVPEWIAESPADYVRLAATLTHDLDVLDRIRHGLRERLRASTLCKTGQFTHGLEDTYRDLWRAWCRDGGR